jgi:hypothetical protein
MFKVQRSAVFCGGFQHARIVQHGVAFKYDGRRLPGLTGDEGLLRRNLYPRFDRARATRPPSATDPGIPLRTPPASITGCKRKRSSSFHRRVGQGMVRGNALNKAVSVMITMVQTFAVPVLWFAASHRRVRTPKTMTTAHLRRRFPDMSTAAAKSCCAVMNSSRPHLGLFADKLVELNIDPVGYELPVVCDPVGMTAADVLGVHRPTGAFVVIEVKTGGEGYLLDTHGSMVGGKPSCVLNHWLAQLFFTYQWARHTYPDKAPQMCNPLLVRVTTTNAFHYPLPSSFRSLPPLRRF